MAFGPVIKQGHLGRVVAKYKPVPNLTMRAIYFGFAAVLALIIFVSKPGAWVENSVISLVLAGFIYVLWSAETSERLVVTERALVVGSTWPFLRPFVLRYEYIVPGTLVPTTGIRKLNPTLNRYLGRNPMYRASMSSKYFVHLIGPTQAQAVADREPNAPRVVGQQLPHEHWTSGFGQDPVEVMGAIASAAAASGHVELAKLTQEAPLRELTGRTEDAERLLPGLHIVGLPLDGELNRR